MYIEVIEPLMVDVEVIEHLRVEVIEPLRVEVIEPLRVDVLPSRMDTEWKEQIEKLELGISEYRRSVALNRVKEDNPPVMVRRA
jgi:hypothetical protein